MSISNKTIDQLFDFAQKLNIEEDQMVMTAPTNKQPKLLKLHFNDSLSQVSRDALESSDESCQDSDDSEYEVRLNPMQRKVR